MDEAQRRTLLVSGRVQGVGYRLSCARVGARLGLDGTVRNVADGRVEVVAAGPADRLDRLVEWCRQGPPAAVVTGVEIDEGGEVTAGAGFRAIA